MRAAALVLALVHFPLPVTTVDAFANPDGSVSIFWTLPADPSVVGVTVFRERLDVFEPEVEFTLGLDTSLTDFTTVFAGSYRYGVHTRNAFGELSSGVFVEVVVLEPVVFVDDVSSGFICVASASTGSFLWAAAVLISSLGVLRPARWGRSLRSRSP